MEIKSLRVLHGPNVYHSKPVVIMTLDLQNLKDTASSDVPHFTPQLIANFNGLQKHTCSKGYEGGFIERLRTGTYFAHIIEHVALELSQLADIPVHFGKTRFAGIEGHYDIVTRFKNEEGMKLCLTSAVEIVNNILKKKTFSVEYYLKKIKEVIHNTSLGPTALSLIEAAERRNIPWKKISQDSLLQFGYGRKMKRMQTAVSDRTSLIASDIAQDKNLTKKLLAEHFIPVPQGVIIHNENELLNALKEIKPPYAIKPDNGNHGRGVSLNLMSTAEIMDAFKVAQTISERVIIEEMCSGKDYRILVIDGKFVAAAVRKPPCVTGDGRRTIAELISELNLDPRRGDGHLNVLTQIEFDTVMEQYFHRKKMTLETVLPEGEIFSLRENANLSSGGTAQDVTDLIHPEVRTMCERAARIVGLDICGIDLIHKDISLPVSAGARIIEINAGPGLRMHIAPQEGKSRMVADYIVNSLFPEGDDGRIPLITVTGTNGKTTTVRLIQQILMKKYAQVGLTTTDGIWIDNTKIVCGDTTGPRSAQTLLSDSQVEAAVLEVARGGILRAGLGYDWSDVAVITNISEDHLGQDGIENIDDLVWIKSVVAERVRKNGTLVLNAEDKYSISLRQNSRVKSQNLNIFLFSVDSADPHLLEHKLSGKNACWVEEGWICVQFNSQNYRVCKVIDVPLTLSGHARFQIANVLASVAAAISIGLESQQIAEVIQKFSSTENSGRFNIYRVHNMYLILDYGHNPMAFAAIGDLLLHMRGNKTAILGLPGDRRNDVLENAALEVAKFADQIILRDDIDLRGRRQSEVPHLLKQVIEERTSCKCEIILNESEALDKALKTSSDNDIVIMFYDDLQTALKTILAYDPQPVTHILAARSDNDYFSLAKESDHSHVHAY